MDRGEASDSFPCFGSTCAVFVIGDGPRGSARAAVAEARRRLLAWHDRFTRFESGSELSRLNADPRAEVPVSPMMARLAAAVVTAGDRSAGLVDGTLLGELEAAGYRADLRASLPLSAALSLAPARRPATAAPDARWRAIAVDSERRTIRRPPGLRLDGGGLAKGLFADALADLLAGHASFAVDCAGDVRVGGTARLPRPVQVQSPFDGRVLHAFQPADGGVATSGIGRRSWLAANGLPAHHLIDPSTGRPAFTGVVQATAVAPTALEAEIRAKTAVLRGPDGALSRLPHGGLVVLDDGSVLHAPPISRPPPKPVSLRRAASRLPHSDSPTAGGDDGHR